MKTNQEIINYFCEIMDPFDPNEVVIHENNTDYVKFSIPHDSYELIIFNLMCIFIKDDVEDNSLDMDIISDKDRLVLICPYFQG